MVLNTVFFCECFFKSFSYFKIMLPVFFLLIYRIFKKYISDIIPLSDICNMNTSLSLWLAYSVS